MGYPISIKTGIFNDEKVKVWIDYNNNAAFEASEVVFSSDNAKQHDGLVTIPTTVMRGVTLRMRVASDFMSAPPITPSGTIFFGQAEDYSIIIPPAVPQANFAANTSESCNGQVVFFNRTRNGARTYLWNFGDGSTSTDMDAVNNYTASGTYTVTLTATNNLGTNVITKNITVNLSADSVKQAACIPVPEAGCCGGNGPLSVILNTTFLPLVNDSLPYHDITCQTAIQTIRKQQTHTLNIQTGVSCDENMLAWIDYNNDGNFTADEKLPQSLNKKNHSINFTIPNTAVESVRLRMRIMTSRLTIPDACTALEMGKVFDYAVIVQEPTGLAKVSQSAAGRFSLYPNPSQGRFTIESSQIDAAHAATISAFDMSGREVKLQMTSNTKGWQVSLPHAAAGLYTIIIRTNDNQAYYLKAAVL